MRLSTLVASDDASGFGHGKAGADGAIEQRLEPSTPRSVKIRRKRLGTEWLAAVVRRRHRKVGAKLTLGTLFEPGAHFHVASASGLERRGLELGRRSLRRARFVAM
jgi:hypothetical protein